MCNITSWLATCGSLKFGQLANVQTVGIGLYLALAVIQGVSTTGVAGLRRRATTLRAAVVGARMRSEFTNMHRLQADVSRLEIGFHSLNRSILLVIIALFGVALIYFAYCVIWQDLTAGVSGTLFILGYYLGLPVTVFAVCTAVIASRCRSVSQRIGDAEVRFRVASLTG